MLFSVAEWGINGGLRAASFGRLQGKSRGGGVGEPRGASGEPQDSFRVASGCLPVSHQIARGALQGGLGVAVPRLGALHSLLTPARTVFAGHSHKRKAPARASRAGANESCGFLEAAGIHRPGVAVCPDWPGWASWPPSVRGADRRAGLHAALRWSDGCRGRRESASRTGVGVRNCASQPGELAGILAGGAVGEDFS